MRAFTLLCLLGLALHAAKRPIAENDLLRFRWAADPRISPDGASVVYTRVAVNAKGDGYETSLWIVPANGGSARQLTAGPADTAARWSPDGTRIAFIRAPEKAGKPEPGQIYVLPMDGGEARPVTSIPKGALNPEWSPDGKRIAFHSTALPADSGKKPEAAPESDVRIITRAAFRLDNRGYFDPSRPSHLWTIDVSHENAKPKQITTGRFSESEAQWSPDGSRLYFLSTRSLEPYYETPDSDVYSVPSEGGEITQVASIDGLINTFALSPDGSRLAFTAVRRGDPVTSYSQPDLFAAQARPGSKVLNLTDTYDFDIGGAITGDQHPPRGGASVKPVWTADGRYVSIVAAEQGRANLKRFDIETGKLAPITDANHDLFSFTADSRGSRFAAAVSTPLSIGDIFAISPSGESRQLTHVNRELAAELILTDPEMLWYQSFDGRRIQAWVQRPPDFQAGTKYPLILNIHGGPHAAYGYTFDHEFQWMAAKGYVVLYPNPRGSTTYGQEFGNVIQYRYPGDDYKDLMAGVDELIRRGWVDPDRMGVTGGSGGGLLTNWTITQTGRFKAAVAQRSIADWGAWWYSADMSLFKPTWFRGAPFREEADYKSRSPITFVERITTPLMLIEGAEDLRTPPSAGGEQMFRALKYLRKPVVMVQFPAESHELSRSGKPKHRIERLQHILAWFDKHLLGRDVKGYDVD